MDPNVLIQNAVNTTLGFFGVLALWLIVYELRRINKALRRRDGAE